MAKTKKAPPKSKTSRKFRLPFKRFPKKTVFIGAFALFGFLVIFVKATTPVDTNFITSVTDLGSISQPANFTGRDGGDSALVGGKVTWIFGDTLYAPTAPTFTGDLFRSATAAIADVNNPTQVSEPLDSRKAPNQLIPHTPEEQAYNIAHRSGSDRYALWPSAIIPKGDGNSAWVLFNDLLISGGKWTTQGTGIASLAANSTLASRQPGMLFAANEQPFRKALVVGSMLYLYSSSGQSLCAVARAPVDQANVRGAYQFWNGSTWVASIGQAKNIIPCSNMGYSVMYNRALKSYVEAIIPNYSKAVYFSYAPAPEGPWSTPIKGFDLPGVKEGSPPYVPNFHPEFSKDGDRTVYLSYSGSTTTVRLVKIGIQPPANGEAASKLAAASYGTAIPSATKAAPAAGSSANAGAATPTATNDTQATTNTPASNTTAHKKTTTKQAKLSLWQRINLYLKRHWNAFIDSLSR